VVDAVPGVRPGGGCLRWPRGPADGRPVTGLQAAAPGSAARAGGARLPAYRYIACARAIGAVRTRGAAGGREKFLQNVPVGPVLVRNRPVFVRFRSPMRSPRPRSLAPTAGLLARAHYVRRLMMLCGNSCSSSFYLGSCGPLMQTMAISQNRSTRIRTGWHRQRPSPLSTRHHEYAYARQITHWPPHCSLLALRRMHRPAAGALTLTDPSPPCAAQRSARAHL
jgi:hypothetical protein